MSNLVPYEQVEKMAVAVAKSGLFGMKTPEQAVALMLLAQAEGMHPAIAARDYHVIQGRPALKADAMLARFQQAGGKVVWNVYSDSEVSATFSHSLGGSVTVSWTLAQAKTAGLTGKDVWKQYPRAMLRARVISEGIRTVYPGVSVGVYTPEEIQDFDVKPAEKTVQSTVVSAPISATEAPAIVEPKALSPQERIKMAGWKKEELSQYAQQAFGVATSKDLNPAQLDLMASVVEASNFVVAMDELNATQNSDDQFI